MRSVKWLRGMIKTGLIAGTLDGVAAALVFVIRTAKILWLCIARLPVGFFVQRRSQATQLWHLLVLPLII